MDNLIEIALTWDDFAPLIDWVHHEERVAVMIGTEDLITDLLLVQNVDGQPKDFYAIAQSDWSWASTEAANRKMRVWGTVHTHTHGSPDPSEYDYAEAHRRAWSIDGLDPIGHRAVFHCATGRLTFYDSNGPYDLYKIPLPGWYRKIAGWWFR